MKYAQKNLVKFVQNAMREDSIPFSSEERSQFTQQMNEVIKAMGLVAYP